MIKDNDYYYKNDIAYPRVTRVCSVPRNEELAKWREAQGTEEADEYTNQARDAGSEIHKLIFRVIKGGVISKGEWESYADEIRNGLTAWERARLTSKGWEGFEPVEAELTLFSDRYRYAGTADALVKCEGGLWLFDWKSGGIRNPRTSEPYEEIKLQLAAYYYAFKEVTGEKLDGCRAIRIDRLTGLWNPAEQIIMKPQELKHYFKGFLPLLEYYKWRYL